jgi:type III secretory pathway lipoprotein EscJ
MKTRNILFILGLMFLLAGCDKALTPAQAASGSYHHCRPVK